VAARRGRGRAFQKLSALFLHAWKLGILGPRWPWYDELIRLVGERKYDRVSRACELSKGGSSCHLISRWDGTGALGRDTGANLPSPGALSLSKPTGEGERAGRDMGRDTFAGSGVGSPFFNRKVTTKLVTQPPGTGTGQICLTRRPDSDSARRERWSDCFRWGSYPRRERKIDPRR
jgi:hypothetical protein